MFCLSEIEDLNWRFSEIWLDLVRFSEIQWDSVIFSGIQRKWTQNRAQNEIIREIVEISETFFFCFEEMCYLFVSWLLIRELFPPCIHRVSKVKLWYVLLVSLLYTLTLVTNRSFFAWCTMNTHFKGRWKKSVKKKKKLKGKNLPVTLTRVFIFQRIWCT